MGKESELLHAVKNADVSTVRKYLVKFKSGPKGRKAISKKVQINIPDEDGFTALHHAALNNNVEIVLALIEMESDPNSRDKKGMCPLHMAAWSGKDQIVKSLLENRALVNLPSFSGETPLLLASQHGYANVVEILLKFNADPTIRNNNLDSPLDTACQFGHTAVVRLLLMRGEVVHMLNQKQIDARFKLPLHLAAKGGHLEVARLLIESGADVNQKTSQGTCLHLAALFGKLEVVKLLIEAGANAHAVNQKNMTPLDMVNEFTTSSAGIEIKKLLREATGGQLIFARAVTDHFNMYDSTCLQFKAGETITVLEQNESGRWKGSICNGKVEKIGFFPSTAVSLISSKKETSSIGSMSSSSDSSLNSATSGKEASVKSPSRMVDSNKPVGIVPVGTYEVLTLASAHATDSKKAPNIPRLNSFKKDTKTATSQRRALNAHSDFNGDASSSNRSSSVDTSIDSGLHSNSSVADSSYDIVPSSNKGATWQTNAYDPLPPPIAKPPRIFPTNPPTSAPNVEPVEHRVVSGDGGATHPPQQYADVSFHRSDKQRVESPMKKPALEYAEVYVSENQGIASPPVYSEARAIPRPANRKTEFRESYENMHLNKELLSKFGKSPDKSFGSNNSSQGYEGMRNQESNDTPAPQMNLKMSSPSSLLDDEEMAPPSPPKKIESRVMNYRRKESYENILPRQIVPVEVQNPFDANVMGQRNSSSQFPQNARYENLIPQMGTMPAGHTNAYENYRPPNSVHQMQRPATVAATPFPLKPVPLPPKKIHSNLQEPTSPVSPSPLDIVRAPFLSELNLEGLNEDERELLNWLIELKLPQYYQNFDSEGYDMVSVRGITPEDLDELQITKAGHRKKLLAEVTKLSPSSKLPAHKPDDVGSWLKILGLRQYESNFIEGGFDEMDFIKDLDQSDLQMIDIKKKGHQRKLLLAVEKLSYMDLTAELDDFVGDKVTSPTATTKVAEVKQDREQPQQQIDISSQLKYPQYDILPKRTSADSNDTELPNTMQQSSPVNETAFPPPPPPSELASSFLLNRDNLPPPSHKESTSHSLKPMQPRAPPAVPTRTVSEKPKQLFNQMQPSMRSRTVSTPVAPKPKPKPRPGQNIGQVRTASEFHGTESPSKSVIMPTPVTKSNVVAEEPELVTASKSRDFWMHNQQQQPQNENLPPRSKSMSGIKPIVSPRPSNDAVSPRLETQERNNVQHQSQPVISNEARRASLKKTPPPAPPRRDSMPKGKDAPSNQGMEDHPNHVGIENRSRTFSGPLDEKIRQAFRGNVQKGSTYRTPITEKPQEEDVFIQPVVDHTKMNAELQATDSIMADIDDMIADFTSQLDSMFDERDEM